ncbi:hypothetical protein J7I98_11955 [Streptomyces sp. ISL-98]|uniref:hypothetical protein n=1 Tax=Streptomyces sp. ISL-98 TaxID=2819192 RepID=UPI001BEA6EB2|nr:hypothetical protein [Streptomyces sp. ISL-98]MBT2506596.1 hypothetical protein [Streptomyces sp. ISL-98]
MRPTRIRSAVLSAALVLMLAAACGGVAQARTVQAPAVPPVDRNCLSPDGTNLNTFPGISERIMGPPACREAFAGEQWVRSFASWGTAASSRGARYPAGYTPSEPNPMDDFLSKLEGVRVVNDIGTDREEAFTFGPEIVRRIAFADRIPFAFFATSPMPPLSVGPHTTTVFMSLSAEHCDGLGRVRIENCLPGGEFRYTGDTPIRFFPRSAG